jgi:hypothetical protein
MSLDIKRKEMELARVRVARQEMELRIMERQEEIDRLDKNIEIQNQSELKLTNEIKTLKGE